MDFLEGWDRFADQDSFYFFGEVVYSQWFFLFGYNFDISGGFETEFIVVGVDYFDICTALIGGDHRLGWFGQDVGSLFFFPK